MERGINSPCLALLEAQPVRARDLVLDAGQEQTLLRQLGEAGTCRALTFWPPGLTSRKTDPQGHQGTSGSSRKEKRNLCQDKHCCTQWRDNDEASPATAAPKPRVSSTPWEVPPDMPQGAYYAGGLWRRLSLKNNYVVDYYRKGIRTQSKAPRKCCSAGSGSCRPATPKHTLRRFYFFTPNFCMCKSALWLPQWFPWWLPHLSLPMPVSLTRLSLGCKVTDTVQQPPHWWWQFCTLWVCKAQQGTNCTAVVNRAP